MEKTIDRVIDTVRTITVLEGLAFVTRRRVADTVGVTETQVSRLATQETHPDVRYDVGISKLVSLCMLRAIAAKDYEVIARGIQAAYWRALQYPNAAKVRSWYPELCDERRGSPLEPVFVAADSAVLELGFRAATREVIAARANVSPATVSNAFGGMTRMPDKLMQWAINRKDAKMLARGLQIDNDVARSAPPALQKQAAHTLLNLE